MTVAIRRIIKAICIILAVVLFILGTGIVMLRAGEASLRKQLSFNSAGLSAGDAYGDYAEVFYNGQGYVYNENLINIMCIGVDKNNIDAEQDRQADALYLISLDTNKHEVNILTISRNTMTDIDIYDMNNEYFATDRAQICLSYVYGADDKHSARLTCQAVSRLLYNIPINTYCTFFTDSLIKIVDTIGGVTVKIPEDMTEAVPSWKKGAEVTLDSQKALRFVRYRDDTNQKRMDRQMIFLKSFTADIKSAVFKDLTLPLELFKMLSNSIVTDINAMGVTYLATEALTSKFSYHSIKGEVGSDGRYETFIADDKALYEQVLNLFYIKTN